MHPVVCSNCPLPDSFHVPILIEFLIFLCNNPIGYMRSTCTGYLFSSAIKQSRLVDLMQLWRYGFTIERLGKRYRLIKPLGRGGMADVCLAVDEHNNDDVAIKVLLPDQLDEELLGRFMKEAALIAGWNHPNIIRIYGDVKWEVLDAKKGSLLPYIVMEYIRGGNLKERLTSDQPYPFPQTVSLFMQVCSAVQYAHEHGIIHRDIKPENILFRQHADGSEDVVLSDFGMAVSLSATHHTFSHAGTPSYMAPEQYQSQAQRASDIYSLGVILYRLCTGRLPFQSQFAQIMHPLQLPPLPSSINTALPIALDEIILIALSADPAGRFPSAQVFGERLQSIVTSFSVSHPPPAAEKGDPTANTTASTKAVQSTSSPPDEEEVSTADKLKDDNDSFSRDNATEPVFKGETSGGPGIIDLRLVPRVSRNTLDLQGSASRGATRTIEPPGAIRRHNGGGPAVADAGLVPGEAPTTPASATQPTNEGQAPPPDALPGRGGHGNIPPRTGRAWLFPFFLLAMLIGGVVYASVNPAAFQAMIFRPFSNQAEITIVPDSKEVQDNYAMQAVTNQPSADQLQVSMRNLNGTSFVRNKLVVGSGQRDQGAPIAAKGRLTFINGSFAPFTVASGTVISASNGVEVVTEQPVVVPAGVPGGASGSVSVPAHAVAAGATGNLSQDSINESCCTADANIFVRNDAPFTGGVDAQTYTFVRQGDVDAAAAPLETILTQEASTQFKQQLKPNEKLVSDPTCNANVQVPPGTVGDQGHDIASTTITVTAKCTGVVYDQGGAQAIAKDRLQKMASIDPGQGYALIGYVATDVSVSKVNPESISLLVNARGIWAYQFDAAKEQALARQLAGKKLTDAQTFLNAQRGISNAKIATQGDTLPTDPTQITFNVQKVSGENVGGTNSNF